MRCARALRLLVVIVALPGCSHMRMERVPPDHSTRTTFFRCSQTPAWPVLDGIAGTNSILTGAAALTAESRGIDTATLAGAALVGGLGALLSATMSTRLLGQDRLDHAAEAAARHEGDPAAGRRAGSLDRPRGIFGRYSRVSR